MKNYLFFCLSFLLVSFAASAQVTTSNIKGLVVDDQAAPLMGANVIAVHTPTGTKYGGITNDEGRYNLLNMRVGGPYTITVTYVGFESQAKNNVYLTLGKTFNFNVTLAESSQMLDEIILVQDQSGTFGSGRTGAETSVGSRELTKLPTISRSASDFTRLEPTASGDSFGGRNDQFNNFSLDGAIFNNPFGLDSPTPGGQTGSQPISLDAIEQIQVSTAPYDVTLSGFTGASVNAVTKSGTNEFHGTVYGFFRNEDLTGGKIKGEDVIKPKLTQNQYGVSIGGPIVKNKLFFFANFEKEERDDLGTNGWIPNTGSGSIGESRVLESDLLAVQSALAGIGYNTGRYQDFTYGGESTKGIFKLDWNINDNNRLAVIYNFLNSSKEKPAHPTAIRQRGPNFTTLQFENSGYEINNNLKSFQIELNSTLSETMTNKLQVGYSHFDDFRDALSSPIPAMTIQDGNGSNYIVVGHEPFSINNTLDQKVFQFSNNTNIFKGDHTYTIGFSFEKFDFKNSFNLGAYGYGDARGYAGAFGAFGSLADFQLAIDNGLISDAITNAEGINTANNANDTWSLAETSVGQMAFYVQDEWNATENFKLTYGVRFDKPLFFDTADKIRENIARKGTYVPSIPYYNPETGEEVFIDSEELPSNQWLISPRIGFNWDAKGDNSLQVRGGTGLFTGRLPFVWLGNQVQGVDVFYYQTVDPDFKFPQVWRTNLGLDKKFENGIIGTLDVSYTKDLNAAHVQNWGLREPTGTLVGPGGDRPVYLSGDTGNNAYVFTNSDKGRVFNVSLKGQKTFDNGLYAMAAYSYLNAQDVNSIEAEITGDAFEFNPNAGNANSDVLSHSKYGDTHRFIGVLSKNFEYGQGKWNTTISTFFEYAKGARYNYTYAGDINGDGSGQNNDLLYVPTSSEISQMQFSGAGQAEAFEAYIQQDDYLKDNRGEFMERYGALAPWRGRWDLKFLQDYKFANNNKIQFSIDVLNVGNLINSDWGIVRQPNNISPVGVSFPDANPDPEVYEADRTQEPTYTFDPSLTKTNGYDASLLSRWQAQFGLRFIF